MKGILKLAVFGIAISAFVSCRNGETRNAQSWPEWFETMELFLTHKGRLNFTTMAKLGKSCESRFRQNFKKSFDWLSFNKSFLEPTKGHRIAIAIDPYCVTVVTFGE